MSYRVELPVFSGPMDLLLHLVKQSEVDIHEVAIAPILDNFLKHLKVLQELDLHDIGDFIVMSSTLMEIKSRELLPNESVELEEELDPRDDLIRRLLEYKRYRDLARELDNRSGRRQRQSNLVMPQPPELKSKDDDDLLDLGELGVWDLTAAFAKLLEEVGQQSSMEVEVEMRDVGYYTHVLLDTFKKDRQVKFSDVFDKKEGRYGMIGTLIALLEMMKQGYLRALQENCFDEISLAYIGEDAVTADLILAGITAEEMREDQEKAAKAAAEAEQGGGDQAVVDALQGEDEELSDASDDDGNDNEEDEVLSDDGEAVPLDDADDTQEAGDLAAADGDSAIAAEASEEASEEATAEDHDEFANDEPAPEVESSGDAELRGDAPRATGDAGPDAMGDQAATMGGGS